MNKLLEYCIKETEYIHEEEVFTIKDLFKGYEWNRLNSGEKRNIGYIFRNYIYSNKELNIINISDNPRLKEGKTKYKKIKKNAK